MGKEENYREYPDRESNSELSFRRALLYPFNYQGHSILAVEEYGYIGGCKVTKKMEKRKEK